jgi:hypothetical protein
LNLVRARTYANLDAMVDFCFLNPLNPPYQGTSERAA